MRTRAPTLLIAMLAACTAAATAAVAGETPVTGRRAATHLTEPAIYPDGTCRRERRVVPFAARKGAPPEVIGVEVALAPHCRIPDGGLFAHLQPAHRFDEALAALHRLSALRAAAARPDTLPFTVACRSELPSRPCPGEARAVLAGLPLHQVFIVEPGHEREWQAAVMPNGPGKPYWSVRWFEAEDRRAVRVELSWKIPAPF